MKHLGTLGPLAAAGLLLAASSAHADPVWIQQPGLAVDIGVAANDIPWVVDINGNVQYGINNLNCDSHSGICTQDGTVTWHMTAGTASHVAVSLDNDVYMSAPNGEVWMPQLWGTATNDNDNNWMKDFDQWYGLVFYNSSHQTASTGQFVLGADSSGSLYTGLNRSLFGILSDSSVQKIVPGIYGCSPGGHVEFCIQNPYWQDTGGIAVDVALFSETSGSVLTQTPWAVTSGGDLYFDTPGGWSAVERPTWSGGGAVGPIRWATDSWILAGNWIWHWNGGVNAERKTGVPHTDYDEVIGGTASMQIKEIAFAGPYPAANMPGSRLWAIDTQNRIWTATDIVYTGQSTNGGNGK